MMKIVTNKAKENFIGNGDINMNENNKYELYMKQRPHVVILGAGGKLRNDS